MMDATHSASFLAAAVWDGQRGRHVWMATEGVPRRQSHHRSGMANLPPVGAIP